MNQNPYSTPISGSEPPTSSRNLGPRLLVALAKFAASYCLGVFLSLACTKANIYLAGVNLLPWYLLLSGIGFVLWFIAAFQELPTQPFEMWWALAALLLPCIGEAIVWWSRREWVRSWRPLWIGLPIGFIGTLGFYWAAALSV